MTKSSKRTTGRSKLCTQATLFPVAGSLNHCVPNNIHAAAPEESDENNENASEEEDNIREDDVNEKSIEDVIDVV